MAVTREQESADRILVAATELVAESGIRATTMRGVADRAGVSRAWLYRLYPDKSALVGTVLMRLVEESWSSARAELDGVATLARKLAVGVQIGRRAYDDPGATLMRLRTREPDEYAAFVGAGVQGVVPDLAAFWREYLEESAAAGEISGELDLAEASEWVARNLISLGTMHSATIDPDDLDALEAHLARFVMPALR
ncbi:TetR/AcrR family transcriptional regulator [Gordonia neofelifaecis]|uniref:Regulatory protein TetR n=1 Tax=Gordonia neofelifaecis NRRL B-59395 TaxID=644548 RepID=F1YGC1_9ACTN|nr:TetR/AcrR family transcriptional regulator [Gordonia neofelifaecis]EGD56140.1 regulatory protein TetR [Gordonia neofelifaecis NRRL B-59395]